MIGVFFMEAGFDAEAPCNEKKDSSVVARTVDVMLIREPWSHARSMLNKMRNTSEVRANIW